jgi:DNA excision repair protein ERCC-2
LILKFSLVLGHYGRCVLVLGIPYQYTLSRVLKCRLEYMKQTYGIDENSYLTFDAMRQSSQCIGRVIRSKNDYGLMIFADRRYARADKLEKLPTWIRSRIPQNNISISTDLALQIAKQFYKQMAQPFKLPKEMLYTSSILNSFNKKTNRDIEEMKE